MDGRVASLRQDPPAASDPPRSRASGTPAFPSWDEQVAAIQARPQPDAEEEPPAEGDGIEERYARMQAQMRRSTLRGYIMGGGDDHADDDDDTLDDDDGAQEANSLRLQAERERAARSADWLRTVRDDPQLASTLTHLAIIQQFSSSPRDEEADGDLLLQEVTEEVSENPPNTQESITPAV